MTTDAAVRCDPVIAGGGSVQREQLAIKLIGSAKL